MFKFKQKLEKGPIISDQRTSTYQIGKENVKG